MSRSVRDYQHEYASYHAKPEQKKRRAQRNAARRAMIQSGRAKKGDGTSVDHKNPIRKGGTNAKSNLRVTSRSANAGWRKGKKGYD